MTSLTELHPRTIRLRRQAPVLLIALVLSACAPGPARHGPGTALPVGALPPTGSATPAAPDTPVRGDPDRRFQEALALMKSRRIQEAQTAFLALSRDYPTFSGPLTDLGILYAQGAQLQLALASLRRAVDLTPHNQVAHNWLGTLHREAGDFAGAERAYRAAIAARPAYAQAHLNLAILHDVALHRPQEALSGYRQYQQLSGDDSLIVQAWIRALESRIAEGRPGTPTQVAGTGP